MLATIGVSTKPATKIAISLPPIELSQNDFEKLKEASGVEDPTPKLVAWAKHFYANLAGGGILLSGSDVRRIEEVTGTDVVNGRTVVEIAQKAVGKEDGKHTFKVQLDPVWIGPATETAHAQGVELQFLIESALNEMVENSWLYSWAPDGGAARFSKTEWAEVQSIVGKKDVFGRDVLAALRAAKAGE